MSFVSSHPLQLYLYHYVFYHYTSLWNIIWFDICKKPKNVRPSIDEKHDHFIVIDLILYRCKKNVRNIFDAQISFYDFLFTFL